MTRDFKENIITSGYFDFYLCEVLGVLYNSRTNYVELMVIAAETAANKFIKVFKK